MRYFEKTKREVLKEMWISKGSMEGNVVNDFFSNITDYKETPKLISLIKKYFKEVVGTSLKGYDKTELQDYVKSLSTSYMEIKNLPKIVENKDVVSNLAYYLASKILKMKQGIGCSYVIYKENGFIKYYFFDTDLEELFGYISLIENKFDEVKQYCGSKKIHQVSTTMSDKELQGTGLGKNMYLTLINEFGCLASDTSLYHSALNIWVNTLPKYSDVYYVDNNEMGSNSVKSISKLPKKWDDIEFLFSVKK